MPDVSPFQTHHRPWRWLLLILPLTLVLTVAVLPVRSAASRSTQRGGQPFGRPLAPGATTWSDFAPTGWVTALPATSSVVAAF